MERELVIRICFRSGGVSEERGTEEQVDTLFAEDTERLIDYAMALEPIDGAIALWQHENDMRWAELEY